MQPGGGQSNGEGAVFALLELRSGDLEDAYSGLAVCGVCEPELLVDADHGAADTLDVRDDGGEVLAALVERGAKDAVLGPGVNRQDPHPAAVWGNLEASDIPDIHALVDKYLLRDKLLDLSALEIYALQASIEGQDAGAVGDARVLSPAGHAGSKKPDAVRALGIGVVEVIERSGCGVDRYQVAVVDRGPTLVSIESLNQDEVVLLACNEGAGFGQAVRVREGAEIDGAGDPGGVWIRDIVDLDVVAPEKGEVQLSDGIHEEVLRIGAGRIGFSD